mmetsp:Transcript_1514/g.2153  ORF Transcript_1514/g.2153 Transcript_1514/m.2153 type:complete len:133 (-) Transcript_1514:457-855(-)
MTLQHYTFFSANDMRVLSDLSSFSTKGRQSSLDSIFRDTYEDEVSGIDERDSLSKQVCDPSLCALSSRPDDPCPPQLKLSASAGSDSFVSSRRMLCLNDNKNESSQFNMVDDSWGHFVDFTEEEKLHVAIVQ